MTLTDAEKHALQNLELKRKGQEAPYINISAARGLTDLGLAERSAQGWDITPAGTALLGSGDAPKL